VVSTHTTPLSWAPHFFGEFDCIPIQELSNGISLTALGDCSFPCRDVLPEHHFGGKAANEMFPLFFFFFRHHQPFFFRAFFQLLGSRQLLAVSIDTLFPAVYFPIFPTLVGTFPQGRGVGTRSNHKPLILGFFSFFVVSFFPYSNFTLHTKLQHQTTAGNPPLVGGGPVLFFSTPVVPWCAARGLKGPNVTFFSVLLTKHLAGSKTSTWQAYYRRWFSARARCAF